MVTRASFVVQDGNAMIDEDGIEDSIIVDPIGPAILVPATSAVTSNSP